MRTLATVAAGRPSVSIAVVAAMLAVLLAVAACAPADSTGPDAVVGQALDRLAAKDVDGMRALACVGQEDMIRDQLGLPASVGGELLPGVDMTALLDAVRLNVSGLDTGEPSIEGDVAQVPVSGTLNVTFDPEAMRPILRQVLDQQGTSMTDEQLNALLGTLEAYGQDVPLDTSVRLIREDGAWKICQDAGPATP